MRSTAAGSAPSPRPGRVTGGVPATAAPGVLSRACIVVAAAVVAALALAATPAWASAPPPPTTGVVHLMTEVPAGSTTTTVPEPTTTTVPPSSTTSTSTTTTVPPRTTTTTVEPRTTTTRPTPTTTTTPSTSSSSKTPWGLIALIVVLAVAIVALALVLRARKKRGVEAAWHRAVVPALSDAQLARVSLLSGNAESEDPQVRGAVAVQVEKAAVALERTVASAPDPDAGAMATTVAGALRGLAFAIEADRLLRQGTSPPSGLQLAQADDARRARTNELNTALARLSARISPAKGSKAAR